MSDLLPPGIHYGITREQYVADTGYNQSSLKAFAKANSPAHYKYDSEHPTLQDKDYIRIGNFVDCSVFHAGEIAKRFVIWPDDRRGKEWTVFKEANADRTILTEAEHERALGTVNAILKNEDANRSITCSKHHIVVIANHPLFGYRLKAELDMLPPIESEWLFDLKTAEDASAEVFNKQAFAIGYDIQACWYMDILSFLPEPITMNNFGFIIAETNPPHGVKTRFFKKDSKEIENARKKINLWLPQYHDCMINNKWPSYTPAWEEIVFAPWMLRDKPQEGEVLV